MNGTSAVHTMPAEKGRPGESQRRKCYAALTFTLSCENGHLLILASMTKLGIPSVALTFLENDHGLPSYLVPHGPETSSRLLPIFHLSPHPLPHLMLGLCCWIRREKWARRQQWDDIFNLGMSILGQITTIFSVSQGLTVTS